MLELPEPRSVPPLPGARVPNVSSQLPGSLALKRNQPVVAAPPGFAAPFSWAEVPVTPVGALVVTLGATAGVVNDSTVPNEVPAVFSAIAQTK